MTLNPYAPPFESLPALLPVFPLEGVLLLPRGRLPLQVFEGRYRAMVADALAGPQRLIGMIQPRPRAAGEGLYETGCAGKITQFTEEQDGRYLITLTGICRFSIRRFLEPQAGYRRVEPAWAPWRDDLHAPEALGIDRLRLVGLLRTYFARHELSCQWERLEDTPDDQLVTCLSMICPLAPEEKQALLESPTGGARAEAFMTMLEMAVRSAGPCSRH